MSAILTERRDRVLIITMNRPEAKNAINGEFSVNVQLGFKIEKGELAVPRGPGLGITFKGV